MYTCLYFLERQFGNLSNFKYSSYSPRHFSWRCIILSAFILVAQSCPTLCNPVDCSPPGSSVPGILQARILKWVAIPFSRGSSWLRDWTWVSCNKADSLPSESWGKLKVFIYLAALSLSCLWDLIPWPGLETGPPALGMWNLATELPGYLHTCRDTCVRRYSLHNCWWEQKTRSDLKASQQALIKFSHLSMNYSSY